MIVLYPERATTTSDEAMTFATSSPVSRLNKDKFDAGASRSGSDVPLTSASFSDVVGATLKTQRSNKVRWRSGPDKRKARSNAWVVLSILLNRERGPTYRSPHRSEADSVPASPSGPA